MAESAVGRIAILGGGVMGETLLTTALSAGCSPAAIVVAEKDPARARSLEATYGVEVTSVNTAVRDADTVLIVVKPQDVAELLPAVRDALQPGAVVASFVAGVRTRQIEAALPAGTAVIRIMPNTPAVVGEGVFGASPGTACSDGQVAMLGRLLAAGGTFILVEEKLQDALTAVSGSGPAYVFYLAEAMIAGGVQAGLDEETARKLTTQTIVGAAKLLSESDEGAAELRQRVTSPNGTTAAAVAAFDERGVKGAIADGVVAAAQRSAELSGA
jgi:pyrroline-5-carboxylate reductase